MPTRASSVSTSKRVRFVSVDAYVAAGGSIVRDLFEADDGGWLTDPALLDRLVDEKLTVIGQRIGEEGWKWVQATIDLPHGAARGLAAGELALRQRALKTLDIGFHPRGQLRLVEDVGALGRAGAGEGLLRVERGGHKGSRKMMR